MDLKNGHGRLTLLFRACQGYDIFTITYTSLMVGVPIPSIQVQTYGADKEQGTLNSHADGWCIPPPPSIQVFKPMELMWKGDTQLCSIGCAMAMVLYP